MYVCVCVCVVSLLINIYVFVQEYEIISEDAVLFLFLILSF